MATIHGSWEQASVTRMADLRRLTLQGSSEAAAAWSRIASRDPAAARLAAAWDEQRAAQQAEANAAAKKITKAAAALVTKGKKIKIKCKLCKRKHGFAEPCKTGDQMGRKIKKARRASLVKSYKASSQRSVPTLAELQQEWRADFARRNYDHADPSVREAWRSGHARQG